MQHSFDPGPDEKDKLATLQRALVDGVIAHETVFVLRGRHWNEQGAPSELIGDALETAWRRGAAAAAIAATKELEEPEGAGDPAADEAARFARMQGSGKITRPVDPDAWIPLAQMRCRGCHAAFEVDLNHSSSDDPWVHWAEVDEGALPRLAVGRKGKK